MRRRSRDLRRNVLFAVIAVALVFYLTEVGLRLAGFEPPYQADAVGGWRMMPRSNAHTVKSHEGASFVLSTNDDGLRTRLTRSKDPGVRRVALLGDSTVFGWGVDDGQTVADGLAAGLAARGVRAEVLNAGQPGYSTTQVERLFANVVTEYRPDLAIVFVPMHDDNRVLVSDREHLDGGAGLTARARVALAKHSRLYQLLRSAILPVDSRTALVPGRDPNDVTRVPRVSAAERDANMDRIRAALAPYKGTLAVGHLPFLGDLEGETPDRYSVPWALAYQSRTDTPIVDLRACCVGQGGATLVLPNDPGHLSATGNQAVGAAAAEQVAALLAKAGR